jgi:hypothetical protein
MRDSVGDACVSFTGRLGSWASDLAVRMVRLASIVSGARSSTDLVCFLAPDRDGQE